MKLKLLNTDHGGSGFQYATYGIWERIGTDQNGNITELWMGANSFGRLTWSGDVPTSGTATYNGRMDGLYATGLAPSQSVTGTASLTANFSDSSIQTRFTNVTVGGAAFRDITGTGTIGSVGGQVLREQFSGTLATAPLHPGQTGPDMAGEFGGNFFGSSAKEAGGVFVMSGGGALVSGGFVAGR